MNMTINAIELHTDIPECMTAEETRSVTIDDEYLGMPSHYIFRSWSSMREEVQQGLQPYCSFKDKIEIIDGITIKVEE